MDRKKACKEKSLQRCKLQTAVSRHSAVREVKLSLIGSLCNPAEMNTDWLEMFYHVTFGFTFDDRSFKCHRELVQKIKKTEISRVSSASERIPLLN